MTDPDIRRRMQERIAASEVALAALTPEASRKHTRPTRPLTYRQEQIARLLSRGMSCPDIGARLKISHRTVEHHIAAIALLLPSDELSARDRVLVWAWWEYHESKAA